MFTHPEGFLEAREQHYQRFFGPITQKVLHSTDFKPVHVDMYQFEPTEERSYWTLITSGMSNERQIEPEDCREGMSPRAEILMYVQKPENWMFSVLKGLAEMPFVNNTCLHWWHTVANGMPMTAKPSLLTSYFFLPPYFESGEGFSDLELDGDRVDFLWMIPITEAEREYAMKHGSQALEKKFEEVELSPVVDEARESVV
ncbi:MAG: suppressor of fused domain protein [Limisphaerales bacterium]